MKSDGLLDRNWLKGALGDAMHAVLCGAGHNLRMILARLDRLAGHGCHDHRGFAAFTAIDRHGVKTSCSGPTKYKILRGSATLNT